MTDDIYKWMGEYGPSSDIATMAKQLAKYITKAHLFSDDTELVRLFSN